MVDYRRMGNMQKLLANSTSTTLLHQLRDLWKSPRGTVIRIEGLALVAIALSFFLVVFWSCRRWSNHWILQKGFLAANGLSLSLGTYSIGLMQSSSVKSDMYPVWGVCLLTLFGCVDPVTEYSLDYKSQLWKIVYQLCLYLGYVLMISISTTSSRVDNKAISLLSAITFIRGFHRALGLLQPMAIANTIRRISFYSPPEGDDPGYVFKGYIDHIKKDIGFMTLDKVWQCESSATVDTCKDVCLSLSLSHLLHQRFYHWTSRHRVASDHKFSFKQLLLKKNTQDFDYQRAFQVIEVELAFLYDMLYSSNSFYSDQAIACSIWSFASVIGICFVGVAVLNPGTSSTGHTSSGTILLETTTADYIITLVVLASLALLQVLQVIRCWTSNWARADFVCDYIRNQEKSRFCRMSPCMILRALLARINCFNIYPWQNKLGQYSFVESISMRECRLSWIFKNRLSVIFGLTYLYRVLREMRGTETGYTIELHPDVKEAIAQYLGKNEPYTPPDLSALLGLSQDGLLGLSQDGLLGTGLTWHIATCYCELAQRKKGFSCFRDCRGYSLREEDSKNHRIATALSKYYAYLLVSAPKLVSMSPSKRYKYVIQEARTVLRGKCDKLEAMRRLSEDVESMTHFRAGVQLGKHLDERTECWKVLADFWVHALVNIARDSDNTEEHIRYISRGGELITHLWALQFHIKGWE